VREKRMHGLTGGRWPSSNHGESDTHAPAGKPTGLSPTTYRSLISQWPTLPA
jgi:hypothetical protein